MEDGGPWVYQLGSQALPCLLSDDFSLHFNVGSSKVMLVFRNSQLNNPHVYTSTATVKGAE